MRVSPCIDREDEDGSHVTHFRAIKLFFFSNVRDGNGQRLSGSEQGGETRGFRFYLGSSWLSPPGLEGFCCELVEQQRVPTDSRDGGRKVGASAGTGDTGVWVLQDGWS